MKMESLPEFMRKSVTWDQGKEMGAALLEGRRGAAVQGVVDGQWVPGSTRCVFRIGCGLRLVGPTFGRFHGQQ
jgi:hypothetical protein